MARQGKNIKRSVSKITKKENTMYFGLCVIAFLLLGFLLFTFFTSNNKVIHTPIYKSSSRPLNQEIMDEYLQKVNFEKKTEVQQPLQHVTNPDTIVKISNPRF